MWQNFNPFVSIIIPSFRRPDQLCHLIERLNKQTYGNYEIIVVEHSQDDEIIKRIEELNDGRIRVITGEPTGLPAARNIGVKNSKGDILFFIDDDDLPIENDWIAAHLKNYLDPNCIGVSGRLCPNDRQSPPPKFPASIWKKAFTYSFFRDNTTYSHCSIRKEGIRFLILNNGSLRRSVFERVGGFDEGIQWGEEHSFFFKLEKIKRPEEYLVFDPKAPVWRRLAAPGGLNRRNVNDWHVKELQKRVIYYHKVVGHYFPGRFFALYPLYQARTLYRVEKWIWDSENEKQSLLKKIIASGTIFFHYPAILVSYGILNKKTKIKRVDKLF